MKRINFYIQPKLLERVRAVAEKKEMTYSQVIRDILMEWFERQDDDE